MYVFKIKNDECKSYEKLKYIFPTMQNNVMIIINIVSKYAFVKRLIVFGSAITPNFGLGSDIDISIETSEVDDDIFHKMIKEIVLSISTEIDIIHYNEIHSQNLKEEIDKGVCVYAKC